MTLRSRYKDTAETVQDFELAAEDRYFEGLNLLLEGHYQGGVYLLGYTAEMLVKYACYRVSGARLSDPVLPATYRRWTQALVNDVDTEGFHSLLFWSTLLRELRRYFGRKLDPLLDQSFAQRMRRIHQCWFVEMRYRSRLVTQMEAAQVYNDVSWMRTYRSKLWS
jgi:hypothetical protein